MIQFLRGNRASLEASEYIPADGQPIHEKDTNLLKVGSGSSSYTALPYLGYSSGGMYWVEINGIQSMVTPELATRAGSPVFEYHVQCYIPNGFEGFILYIGYLDTEDIYLSCAISTSNSNFETYQDVE